MHEFSYLQDRAMNQVTYRLIVHVHQFSYFIVRHLFYIAIIDHFVLLGRQDLQKFFHPGNIITSSLIFQKLVFYGILRLKNRFYCLYLIIFNTFFEQIEQFVFQRYKKVTFYIIYFPLFGTIFI